MKKGDIIEHNYRNYKCICADDEVAVFGEYCKMYDTEGDLYSSTSYQDVIVVSQDEHFEHEKIKL